MSPKDTGPRRRTSWRYVGHTPLAYLDSVDSGTLWNGQLDERIALLEGLARRVLREAGLPDRLCHCVPIQGGWREAAPHELPGATYLLDIVERAPHGWMERTAVRMLGHADALRQAVAAGDDVQAATNVALTLALQAGGLALVYEFGPDLRAGQRQRIGGSKGGRRAREESEAVERHRRWAEEDEQLEARGKRPAERARLIAREHKAKPETVRSAVRRLRKKLVSEAPPAPDG